MAFSIKNDEADRLARQLAAITGESLTDAVIRALRERLARRQTPARRHKPGAELAKMARRLGRLPLRDVRPPDAIPGYDENGLPT